MRRVKYLNYVYFGGSALPICPFSIRMLQPDADVPEIFATHCTFNIRIAECWLLLLSKVFDFISNTQIAYARVCVCVCLWLRRSHLYSLFVCTRFSVDQIILPEHFVFFESKEMRKKNRR